MQRFFLVSLLTGSLLAGVSDRAARADGGQAAGAAATAAQPAAPGDYKDLPAAIDAFAADVANLSRIVTLHNLATGGTTVTLPAPGAAADPIFVDTGASIAPGSAAGTWTVTLPARGSAVWAIH